MTDREKRCEDCACLIKKNGVWCCDECFGQKCNDIDTCPDGIELDEVEKITEQTKGIKIQHGAKADEPTEKAERKPKVVKISDEKAQIFSELIAYLSEIHDISVVKDNKLVEIYLNGKTFKLDLIETRAKK